MTAPRALVLAGTGMLSAVTASLVGDGWRVVQPCRRYSPIAEPEPRTGRAALRALRPRGHRPTSAAGGKPGRALWVEAQWDRPRALADKAESALGGPADLVVAWVHEQYRRSVLGACERLLAPRAPVVEVRGVGGPAEEPEPVLAAHPTQLVLVGSCSGSGSGGPLSHAEVTEAIAHAVSRAIGGHAASLHQVGQSRPLVR